MVVPRPVTAGSLRTQREAKIRRDWVAGELSAMRVPDLKVSHGVMHFTLADAAERGRTSRVDVSEGTMTTYRVAIGRLTSRLGATDVERIDAQRVADLVAELHADKLKKQRSGKPCPSWRWSSTTRV